MTYSRPVAAGLPNYLKVATGPQTAPKMNPTPHVHDPMAITRLVPPGRPRDLKMIGRWAEDPEIAPMQSPGTTWAQND
eukprot:2861297-Pyramimonas_sp.AAC.1